MVTANAWNLKYSVFVLNRDTTTRPTFLQLREEVGFWTWHGIKVHRRKDRNANSNECIRQFSWVWLRRLSCTGWELYCRLHSGRTAQCWQSNVATRAEHLLLIDMHRSSSQEVELNCRFLVFVEDVYLFLIFLDFSWQAKLEFPRWLNMSKCVRLERTRMKLYVVWENNLCSFGCIELPTLKVIFDDQFEPKEKPQSSVHPWPWVEFTVMRRSSHPTAMTATTPTSTWTQRVTTAMEATEVASLQDRLLEHLHECSILPTKRARKIVFQKPLSRMNFHFATMNLVLGCV